MKLYCLIYYLQTCCSENMSEKTDFELQSALLLIGILKMMHRIRTLNLSKSHHDSTKISKPLFRGQNTSISSTSRASARSSYFFPLLAGFVSGILFGGAVGFLAGKYPFLSSKAGFKQKPEKFIARPKESRLGEGEEVEDGGNEGKRQLDRMIKTCEATIKVAEIAILSTMSVAGNDSISSSSDEPVDGEVTESEHSDSNDAVSERISTQALPQSSKKHDLLRSPPSAAGSLSSDSQNRLQPESRPIYPFPVEPGIPHVHFSTNRLSRKFSQLQSNPKVSLTYLDKEGAGYVTLKGEAEILSLGESATLWRDELILYYPEGKTYLAGKVGSVSCMQACFYTHPGEPWHALLLPGTPFLSSMCPVGTQKK